MDKRPYKDVVEFLSQPLEMKIEQVREAIREQNAKRRRRFSNKKLIITK